MILSRWGGGLRAGQGLRAVAGLGSRGFPLELDVLQCLFPYFTIVGALQSLKLCGRYRRRLLDHPCRARRCSTHGAIRVPEVPGAWRRAGFIASRRLGRLLRGSRDGGRGGREACGAMVIIFRSYHRRRGRHWGALRALRAPTHGIDPKERSAPVAYADLLRVAREGGASRGARTTEDFATVPAVVPATPREEAEVLLASVARLDLVVPLPHGALSADRAPALGGEE